MARFRRAPENRFHIRYPRSAGAIGGLLGGLTVAGILYAIVHSFGSNAFGLAAACAWGTGIGSVIGAAFPRIGHRALCYVWCMGLGL